MGKDSNEIRREIEQTRARMGDTVEALGYKADVPSRVKDAVNDRVETVKGSIGDALSSVKDAVGGVTGKVGTALGGAKTTMTTTLSDTTERVGDVTNSVTDKIPSGEDVKNVARRGVGIAAENPIGLALGALAVGFLAGLVTPVTDLEREKVGPIRDDLLEKAQSIGSDVLEHGKQVLQETAQAAVQTAQAHGQQVLSEVKGDTAHGGGTNGGASGGTGRTSTEYGALLDEDEDTLRPGAPGTASP